MKLTVNGDERQFDRDTLALADLLEELGLSGQPLLVEHNGTALHPADQAGLTLGEGDCLELLRLVAGG